MNKVIYVAFFRSIRLVKIIKLEGQEIVAINTIMYLPEILKKCMLGDSCFHDNASSNLAMLKGEILD